MIGQIIGTLGGKIADAVGTKITNKTERERIVAMVQTAAMSLPLEEMQKQVSVIVAEAQSDSWLTRSWRPITMLTFVGLIVAHWLGYTSPNLSEAEVLLLLEIVKVGLGGYVLSRGAEKVVKEYKKP